VEKCLREAGIKTKRCVTAVSGRSVIFRQVAMTRVPDAELRQAIEWEADKYIPFDVNEVQLDAQRLEDGDGEGTGQTKVLLVAVKKAQVEEHIALLQSVGLRPVIIDVDVFALGNAFELRNLTLGILDNEVRALVDIGASKTNINIMRGNVSCFPREIYVAGNDLTEAVAKRFGEDARDVEKMKREPGGALESMQDAMLPVLEDIGSEIRLSFDYFESQYEQKVKEVYLSGGSAFFPGLDTMLTQVFNLPVKLWDPTEGLEIRNYSAAGMGGTNSNMAIALGLSSRLLSTAGYGAPAAVAAPGAAVAPAAAPGLPPAARLAVEAEQARKAWTKGVAMGALACAAVAVVAVFLNRVGYHKPWVILEAIPLGLAAGLGLWSGVRALRPLPGRLPIAVASLCTALLCCGALLLVRVAMKDGSLKRTLAPARVTTVIRPRIDIELPADFLAAPHLQARRNPMMNVDFISGGLYVLTHWLLTCAMAMFVVWGGFSQVAKREAVAQLARATVPRGGT
jgi:type IV pilus assembly protein PilM